LNNIAPPPAIAPRQDGGNGRIETTKADAPASSSPASPAAEPPHEHSPVNATAHATADSSGTAVQATGTVQPQPASAPATAGSLSVTAAINAAVPLSGLALEIAVSARSGKSRFEIRLDPADLGRIDVRIDIDRSGRVTSHLTVEKPETLSMLRQDAPQLQRALDDAGLKTGNGSLQFSLRDQSSSGQDGNETGRNAQRLVISDDETIPAAVAGSEESDMTAASGLAPPVVSGTTPIPTSSSSGSSGSSLSSTTDSTLAGNFQTFLTLLTTQLQNQNPLDPLDTNE
jgi:flagellar hook-length control protein FliK